MASTTNLLKVTQFSKDMNMKSKDVLDVLANKGIVIKSQATLEVAQFEMLFDTLTRNNQIDNTTSCNKRKKNGLKVVYSFYDFLSCLFCRSCMLNQTASCNGSSESSS